MIICPSPTIKLRSRNNGDFNASTDFCVTHIFSSWFVAVCVCACVSVAVVSVALLFLRSFFCSLLLSVVAIKRRFSVWLPAEREPSPSPIPRTRKSQRPGLLFELNARVALSLTATSTQSWTLASITVMPTRTHVVNWPRQRPGPSRAKQSSSKSVNSWERTAHVERAWFLWLFRLRLGLCLAHGCVCMSVSLMLFQIVFMLCCEMYE